MASRYEQSLELQRMLDTPVEDEQLKLHFAQLSLASINEGWRAHQHRLIHSNAGIHIDDELTVDSINNPTRLFGEIILRGTVPEVRCISLFGRYIVTLPVYEPTVLGPQQEIEAELVELEMDMSGADATLPIGVPMRRPIYVPVEDMHFSMFLAA